jgi:hypothetical protein
MVLKISVIGSIAAFLRTIGQELGTLEQQQSRFPDIYSSVFDEFRRRKGAKQIRNCRGGIMAAESHIATLLHISVSPRGEYSISRQLGVAAERAWKKKHPGGRVIERDLTKTPLTFVDLDWIAGAFSPPEHHNENHKKALAISNELISELFEADEII